MLAVRIQENGLSIQEIPKVVSGGEAVVRVLKSGICGTDLELVKGYSGFLGTPGHEFVGQVEVSADRPELIGKRVVGEINAGCGTCTLCQSGDSRHCPDRSVLGIVGRDGAHAEYLRLPARNLLLVPESVSNDEAVFIEPLAAAMGIGESVDFGQMVSVAVIGDGKLGILCARAIAAMDDSPTVILIGKHDQKLNLAAKAAVETVKVDRTKEFEKHFDTVVEASGSESGFATALDIVKPRGRIVLKSTYHGLARWDASRVVVNEITVIGSRCGRFQPAIDALASNQIEVDDLISEEFSLSDGVAAFERAASTGVLKILLNASD